MPPPIPRFSVGGASSISPYHQQFPTHGQQGATHPPPGTLGNPSYLNANAATLSSFSGNGNLLNLATAGGMNAGGVGPFGGADTTGLASHAARMSFAHGGTGLHQQQHAQQHVQQQHGQSMSGDHHPARNQSKSRIRDVWKHNLQEEMAKLRELVDRHPYIAMDTEFPGVVARPMGEFRGKSDYHYQCLRTNVDLLSVIQIGITLFTEGGETPPARPSSADSTEMPTAGRRNGAQGASLTCSWQFNFKFDLNADMYNQTSIDSLQQAGIDFGLLERDGIDPHDFASLLIPSGLVCFEDVKWISFHGGYDFGYLTKLLICRQLPCEEVEFEKMMKYYFPSTYDVKHLMKNAIKLQHTGQMGHLSPEACDVLAKFEQKSGLEHLTETLKIKRIGLAHTAGSDSLLTGKIFFALREKIYGGEIAEDHFGKIWGLGVPDYSVGGGGGVIFNSGGPAQNLIESTPPQNGGGAGTETSAPVQQNGNAPNTPSSTSVTLVNTPGPQSQQGGGGGSSHANGIGGMGPMTPGGGGGVFGQFAFSGNSR